MVKFLERWRVRKSRIWNLTNCRLCQNRGLCSYCGLSLSLNLIIKIVIFIYTVLNGCLTLHSNSLFFLFSLCSEVDIFKMSFSFLYLTEEKFSITIFLFCHGNIKLIGNFNTFLVFPDYQSLWIQSSKRSNCFIICLAVLSPSWLKTCYLFYILLFSSW